MSGYRDWFTLRDLGLSEATHGQYDAYVNRVNKMGGQGGRHYHEYDLQVMYILQGRARVYCEGEGEFIMEAGDFVCHPPRLVHDLMEYSEDLEILQISSPNIRASVDV